MQLNDMRVAALHPRFSEFARYLTVGGLAFLLDAMTYWVMWQCGAHYMIAALGGFVVGVCVSYFLSVRWVFEHRNLENKDTEMFLFIGTGVLGLVLTEVLLWAMIDQLHVGAISAKLLASILVLGANFGVRKTMLFSEAGARVA